MYLKQLQTIGLSENAAKIYELLLENGSMPASRISRLSSIERSLVYVVLNDLHKKKLVFKDDEKGVTRFEAAHPTELEKLVSEKQIESDNANSAFTSVIHQLQQQYEIQSGQPGVRFFDGATGIKHTTDKLRSLNIDEMLLIRSIKSSKDMAGYSKIIHEQQQYRIKNKIKLKVIAPSIKSIAQKIDKDKENLIERRIIAEEVLDTQAQVLIYGDNVAITTFNEPPITTIIENAAIATTMKSMFTYMWRMSLKETETFRKRFDK